MPYRVNGDLPPSVRNHLPDHARDLYREAFNHAFAADAGELDRPYDRLSGGQAQLRQGRQCLGGALSKPTQNTIGFLCSPRGNMLADLKLFPAF